MHTVSEEFHHRYEELVDMHMVPVLEEMVLEYKHTGEEDEEVASVAGRWVVLDYLYSTDFDQEVDNHSSLLSCPDVSAGIFVIYTVLLLLVVKT